MSQLVLDVGQTGIRAEARGAESSAYAEEFPGVRTDLPIFPQLAEVTRLATEHSGRTVELLSAGVSGLLDDDPVPELLELVRPLGVQRVVLAHDSVTSYLGALGDVPGVVCAAGTGVVTLGVGGACVARVDGWGNLLGDAGAGYWIGRRGLEAVMRAYDGRGRATALTAVAQRDFGNLENAYIALQADPRRVSRIAAYSRRVDELADAGDDVCADIMRAAAAELFHSCATALERVGESARPSPAMCTIGKVFTSALLSAEFARLVDARWPGTTVRDPLATSLEGAALLPYLGADSAVRAKVRDVS